MDLADDIAQVSEALARIEAAARRLAAAIERGEPVDAEEPGRILAAAAKVKDQLRGCKRLEAQARNFQNQ